jgi:hypothetical protein
MAGSESSARCSTWPRCSARCTMVFMEQSKTMTMLGARPTWHRPRGLGQGGLHLLQSLLLFSSSSSLYLFSGEVCFTASKANRTKEEKSQVSPAVPSHSMSPYLEAAESPAAWTTSLSYFTYCVGFFFFFFFLR